MKTDWKTCFRIGVSIFLLYLAVTYWPAAMRLVGTAISAGAPLIIGGVIAYLVNIPMTVYEDYLAPDSNSKLVNKLRRPLCMVLAFATIAAILALLFKLVVPELISCLKLIFSEIPDTMRFIIIQLDKLGIFSDEMIAQLESIDWRSQLGKIFKVLIAGIGSTVDIVVTTVTSVMSTVITAFISIIFSIYLLTGRDTLRHQCNMVMNKYMPKKIYNTVVYVLHVLNDCFHKYIVGQCTEAVILGSLCAGGMLILKLPYATMIGALVAFTALIPVAGAYIGAAVGAFMILTVSPVQAIGFVVYLVILQQFEGNIIYPRVVGGSMGLPALWVLAAVTIGGGLMGIVGMLLGVPIAAAAYTILRNDLNGSHVAPKSKRDIKLAEKVKKASEAAAENKAAE